MPPYCERHQMFHSLFDECWKMREQERAEMRARLRREKAERIAAEVADEYVSKVRVGRYMPTEFHGQHALPDHVKSLVLDAATAAALAALTEKENAR